MYLLSKASQWLSVENLSEYLIFRFEIDYFETSLPGAIKPKIEWINGTFNVASSRAGTFPDI